MAFRMPYWMRIGIGAMLGVIALLALWPTLGLTWLTALVAALAAPIGFLGSYFVVTADRPEEGYEQVLFDRPNTLVAAVMILAFAGAGIGTGFLPAASTAQPPTPAEYVFQLKADHQSVFDGWTKENADKAGSLARVDELRVESDRIALDLETLPEGDARRELEAANDAYAFALDALKMCIRADARSCLESRLLAADAEIALQRYVALDAAPADARPAGEAPEA